MVTAREVLLRYLDEELPEFVDRPLGDVNQVGRFGNTPLHVAAARGDVEEIWALIEAGADVNAVGELGDRPIHEAIRRDNDAGVRLLLEAGALLDVVNELGQSAGALAEQSSNRALVDLVRERKNRPDRR